MSTNLNQLPRKLLVQNFLHCEWDNDGVVGFEETVYLAQRVVGVIEGDEEGRQTSSSVVAGHQARPQVHLGDAAWRLASFSNDPARDSRG